MKHNRRTPREIMRKLTMADQLIMEGKMVANAVSISTPNLPTTGGVSCMAESEQKRPSGLPSSK
jgi:hypothetical protein